MGVTQAGFKRVRFHGIFNDELGVFGRSIMESRRNGGPNWQNIYRVYDGLLENGAAPMIELSFMPTKLASGKAQFGFYGGNITPPASDEAYAGFIKAFAAALVERYGIDKVSGWPIEIWNEPNLPFFWTGNQQRYFEMYKAAAVAIKSLDARLQVGGPVTSGAAWISEFCNWAAANNAPVDFIATHAYAGDDQKQVFGDERKRSINDVIPEAMRLVRSRIDATALAGKPLWLSEWSSDSPAMIAHVIRNSMPHCAGMSQWVLSGIYEELGPDDYILKEGSMGWSMLIDGIAKPSFNTYRLLHRLGTEQLHADGPVIASRKPNGKTAALIWNLAETDQPGGIPGMTSERNVRGTDKRISVAFAGARKGQPVTVTYADWVRGSPMPMWRAMGSPKYMSREQVAQLRKASVPIAERRRLDSSGGITLELPPEGIALLELD